MKEYYNEELAYFLARHLYEEGSSFTSVDSETLEPIIYIIPLKESIKNFLDNRNKE